MLEDGSTNFVPHSSAADHVIKREKLISNNAALIGNSPEAIIELVVCGLTSIN